MKRILLFLLFITTQEIVTAQVTSNPYLKGDTFILSEVAGDNYLHIDFPRKNEIIKRGAIANFKSIVSTTLIVDGFFSDKKGKSYALLRRKDGKNFFRFFPKVKVDLTKAIAKGELKKVNS